MPSSITLMEGLPADSRDFAASSLSAQFIRIPLRFGSRSARVIDRNFSVAFARCTPFGQCAPPVSILESILRQSMPRKSLPGKSLLGLSRRSFLGGSAALAASPALAPAFGAAGPASADVDVVIIGAGAAGIAAARKHRRRRPPLYPDRSDRSHRRPLHHRHQDLRRALSTAARTGSTCPTATR